jgi:hypothetical protein
MADRVIIAWNFRNWTTIVLMSAIGMALIGIIVTFIRGNLPGGAPSSLNTPSTPATS